MASPESKEAINLYSESYNNVQQALFDSGINDVEAERLIKYYQDFRSSDKDGDFGAFHTMISESPPPAAGSLETLRGLQDNSRPQDIAGQLANVEKTNGQDILQKLEEYEKSEQALAENIDPVDESIPLGFAVIAGLKKAALEYSEIPEVDLLDLKAQGLDIEGRKKLDNQDEELYQAMFSAAKKAVTEKQKSAELGGLPVDQFDYAKEFESAFFEQVAKTNPYLTEEQKKLPVDKRIRKILGKKEARRFFSEAIAYGQLSDFLEKPVLSVQQFAPKSVPVGHILDVAAFTQGGITDSMVVSKTIQDIEKEEAKKLEEMGIVPQRVQIFQESRKRGKLSQGFLDPSARLFKSVIDPKAQTVKLGDTSSGALVDYMKNRLSDSDADSLLLERVGKFYIENPDHRIQRSKLNYEDFVQKIYPDYLQQPAPSIDKFRDSARLSTRNYTDEQLRSFYSSYESSLPSDFNVQSFDNISPKMPYLSSIDLVTSSTDDENKKRRINIIKKYAEKRDSGQSVIDTYDDVYNNLVPGLGLTLAKFPTISFSFDDLSQVIDAANESALRSSGDGTGTSRSELKQHLHRQQYDQAYKSKMLSLGVGLQLAGIPYHVLRSDVNELLGEERSISGIAESLTPATAQQFIAADNLDNYVAAQENNRVLFGDLSPSISEIFAPYVAQTGVQISPTDTMKDVFEKIGPLSSSDQLRFNRSIKTVKGRFQSQGVFDRGMAAFGTIAQSTKYDPTSGQIYYEVNPMGRALQATAVPIEFLAETDVGIPIGLPTTLLGSPEKLTDLNPSHDFIIDQATRLRKTTDGAFQAALLNNNIEDFLNVITDKDGKTIPEIQDPEDLENAMNLYEDAAGNKPFAGRDPYKFLGAKLVVAILNSEGMTFRIGTPRYMENFLQEKDYRGSLVLGDANLGIMDRVAVNVGTEAGPTNFMGGYSRALNPLGFQPTDSAVKAFMTAGLVADIATPDPASVLTVGTAKGLRLASLGGKTFLKVKKAGATKTEAGSVAVGTVAETIGPRSRALADALYPTTKIVDDPDALLQAVELTSNQKKTARQTVLRGGDLGAAAAQTGVLWLAGTGMAPGLLASGAWWGVKKASQFAYQSFLLRNLPTEEGIQSGNISLMQRYLIAPRYLAGETAGTRAGNYFRNQSYQSGVRNSLGLDRTELQPGDKTHVTGSNESLRSIAAQYHNVNEFDLRDKNKANLPQDVDPDTILDEQTQIFITRDPQADNKIVRDQFEAYMNELGYTTRQALDIDDTRKAREAEIKEEEIAKAINRRERNRKEELVENTFFEQISRVVDTESFINTSKDLRARVARGQMTPEEALFFKTQLAMLSMKNPNLFSALEAGKFKFVLDFDYDYSGQGVIDLVSADLENPRPFKEVRSAFIGTMTQAQQSYWRSRGLFDFIESKDTISLDDLNSWMNKHESNVEITSQIEDPNVLGEFETPVDISPPKFTKTQSVKEPSKQALENEIIIQPSYQPIPGISVAEILVNAKTLQELFPNKYIDRPRPFVPQLFTLEPDGTINFVPGAKLTDVVERVQEVLVEPEPKPAPVKVEIEEPFIDSDTPDVEPTQAFAVNLGENQDAKNKNRLINQRRALINTSEVQFDKKIEDLGDGNVLETVRLPSYRLIEEDGSSKFLSEAVEYRVGRKLEDDKTTGITFIGKEQAKKLVEDGNVFVNGKQETDPTFIPERTDVVEIRKERPKEETDDLSRLGASADQRYGSTIVNAQVFRDGKLIESVEDFDADIEVEIGSIEHAQSSEKELHLMVIAAIKQANKLFDEDLIVLPTRFDEKGKVRIFATRQVYKKLAEGLISGDESLPIRGQDENVRVEILVDGEAVSDTDFVVPARSVVEIKFQGVEIAPARRVEAKQVEVEPEAKTEPVEAPVEPVEEAVEADAEPTERTERLPFSGTVDIETGRAGTMVSTLIGRQTGYTFTPTNYRKLVEGKKLRYGNVIVTATVRVNGKKIKDPKFRPQKTDSIQVQFNRRLDSKDKLPLQTQAQDKSFRLDKLLSSQDKVNLTQTQAAKLIATSQVHSIDGLLGAEIEVNGQKSSDPNQKLTSSDQVNVRFDTSRTTAERLPQRAIVSFDDETPRQKITHRLVSKSGDQQLVIESIKLEDELDPNQSPVDQYFKGIDSLFREYLDKGETRRLKVNLEAFPEELRADLERKIKVTYKNRDLKGRGFKFQSEGKFVEVTHTVPFASRIAMYQGKVYRGDRNSQMVSVQDTMPLAYQAPEVDVTPGRARAPSGLKAAIESQRRAAQDKVARVEELQTKIVELKQEKIEPGQESIRLRKIEELEEQLKIALDDLRDPQKVKELELLVEQIESDTFDEDAVRERYRKLRETDPTTQDTSFQVTPEIIIDNLRDLQRQREVNVQRANEARRMILNKEKTDTIMGTDQKAAEESILGVVGRRVESTDKDIIGVSFLSLKEDKKTGKLSYSIPDKDLTFMQLIAREAVSKTRRQLKEDPDLDFASVLREKFRKLVKIKGDGARKAIRKNDTRTKQRLRQLESTDPLRLSEVDDIATQVGFEPNPQGLEIVYTPDNTAISRGSTSTERIYQNGNNELSVNTGRVDNEAVLFIDDVFNNQQPSGLRDQLIRREFDTVLDKEAAEVSDAQIRQQALDLLNSRDVINPTSDLRTTVRDVLRDKETSVFGSPSGNPALHQMIKQELELAGIEYRMEQRKHANGLLYDVFYTNIADTKRLDTTPIALSYREAPYGVPHSEVLRKTERVEKWIGSLDDDSLEKGFHVERSVVSDMSQAEIDQIQDPVIREALEEKFAKEDLKTASEYFADKIEMTEQIDSDGKKTITLTPSASMFDEQVTHLVYYATTRDADYVVIKSQESSDLNALDLLAERWDAEIDQDGTRIVITEDMKRSVAAPSPQKITEYERGISRAEQADRIDSDLNEYLDEGLHSDELIMSDGNTIAEFKEVADQRQILVSTKASLSDLLRQLSYLVESMLSPEDYARLTMYFDSVEIGVGNRRRSVLTRKGKDQLAENIHRQMKIPSTSTAEGVRSATSPVIGLLKTFEFIRQRDNVNVPKGIFGDALNEYFNVYQFADELTYANQRARAQADEVVQETIYQPAYSGVDALARVAETRGTSIREAILKKGRVRQREGEIGKAKRAEAAAAARRQATIRAERINELKPSAFNDHLNPELLRPERQRARENIAQKALLERLGREPTADEITAYIDEYEIQPSGAQVDEAFFQLVDEGGRIDFVAAQGRAIGTIWKKLIRNQQESKSAIKYVNITNRTIARKEDHEFIIDRAVMDLYKIFGETTTKISERIKRVDSNKDGDVIAIDSVPERNIPIISYDNDLEQGKRVALNAQGLFDRADGSPINLYIEPSLRNRVDAAARGDAPLVLRMNELDDFRDLVIDLAGAHLSYRNFELETAYTRPIQALFALFYNREEVREDFKLFSGLEYVSNVLTEDYLYLNVSQSGGVQNRAVISHFERAQRNIRSLPDRIKTLLLEQSETVANDPAVANLGLQGIVRAQGFAQALYQVSRMLRRTLNAPVSVDHLHILQGLHNEIREVRDAGVEGIVDFERTNVLLRYIDEIRAKLREKTSVDQSEMNNNYKKVKEYIRVVNSGQEPSISQIKTAQDAYTKLYREVQNVEPKIAPQKSDPGILTVREFKETKIRLYRSVFERELSMIEQEALRMVQELPDTDLTPEQQLDYQRALDVLFQGVEKRFRSVQRTGAIIFDSISGISKDGDGSHRGAKTPEERRKFEQKDLQAYVLFMSGRISKEDIDFTASPETPVPRDGKQFTTSELIEIAKLRGFDGEDAQILTQIESAAQQSNIRLDLKNPTPDQLGVAVDVVNMNFKGTTVGSLMDLADTDATLLGISKATREGLKIKDGYRNVKADPALISLEILVRLMAEEEIQKLCENVLREYLTIQGKSKAVQSVIRETFDPISARVDLENQIVSQLTQRLNQSVDVTHEVADQQFVASTSNTPTALDKEAGLIAEDIISLFNLNKKNTREGQQYIMPNGERIILPSSFIEQLEVMIQDVAVIGRAAKQSPKNTYSFRQRYQKFNQRLALRNRIVNKAADMIVERFGKDPKEAREIVETYLIEKTPEYTRAYRAHINNVQQLETLSTELRNVEGLREAIAEVETNVATEFLRPDRSVTGAVTSAADRIGKTLQSSMAAQMMGIGAGMASLYAGAPFLLTAAIFSLPQLAAPTAAFLKRKYQVDPKIRAVLDDEYLTLETEVLRETEAMKKSDERSIVYFDEEQGQFIVSKPQVKEVLGSMLEGLSQRYKSQKAETAVDLGVGALTGLGVGLALGGTPGLLAGLYFAGKGVSGTNRMIKQAVTVGVLIPTAAYFTANAIGAFFQGYSAYGVSKSGDAYGFAASQFGFFRQVVQLMHGDYGITRMNRDSKSPIVTLVTKDGRIFTPERFVSEANAYGIGSSFIKTELARTLQADLERADPTSYLTILQQIGMSNLNAIFIDWAQSFDNLFRISFFMKEIHAGKSMDVAAKSVRDAFYDYAELSPAEKNWARQIFLFYSFMRKNNAQMLRVFFENPDRIVRQLRFTYYSQQNALRDEEKGFIRRPSVFIKPFYQSRVHLPGFTDIVDVVNGKTSQAPHYRDKYLRSTEFGPALPAQDSVGFALDTIGQALFFGEPEAAGNTILMQTVPQIQLFVAAFTGKMPFLNQKLEGQKLATTLVDLTYQDITPEEKETLESIELGPSMVDRVMQQTKNTIFGPKGSGALVEVKLISKKGVAPLGKRAFNYQVVNAQSGLNYAILQQLAQGIPVVGLALGRTQKATLNLIDNSMLSKDAAPGTTGLGRIKEDAGIRTSLISSDERAMEEAKRSIKFDLKDNK